MSYLIAGDSPKKAAAQRFAVELERALRGRDISVKALNRALGGTSQTKLWHYKSARLLPRLSTAIEIAEALQWPRLAEIVREERSKPCHQCGRMFVMEGGSANKRYCSGRCRDAALKLRAHLAQAENAEEDPERRLVARVKAELDRVQGTTRPVSRRELQHVIGEYEATKPQARTRRLQNITDQHISAVEAFCNGCEPEGMCRDAECALRPVSPLPLGRVRDVEAASKPPGRWGHPGAREAFSASLRLRHAENPEWRENTRRRSRQMWADLTPEERRDRVRALVDGQARMQHPECGCPKRGHKALCRFARPRRSEVAL